jgi:proteasome lid subunit RPN8/RPN11
MRSPFKKRPPATSTAQEAPDLLVEAEEEAFRAVSRSQPTPQETHEPEADETEIAWDDLAEVYTAKEAVFAEFPLASPFALGEGETAIRIRREAYAILQSHLRSNIAVEQGGLLTGIPYFDSTLNAYLLCIEEALPAPQGVETAHSFSYTSETLQALAPHLQSLPPDWTTIGSYHSHPNLGVFLSQTDLDTQAQVFPHPWQIAIVVDPVRDEIGFFVGEDGVPCEKWSVV